jgi:hypothetical protein
LLRQLYKAGRYGGYTVTGLKKPTKSQKILEETLKRRAYLRNTDDLHDGRIILKLM